MLALDDGAYSDAALEPLHWAEIDAPKSDEGGRTRVWSHFNSQEASDVGVETEKGGDNGEAK